MRLLLDFTGGFLAAQLFLTGLLFFDIGEVATLVARSEAPILPLAMLSLSLGGLVGAAALATPQPEPPLRPLPRPAAFALPVRVSRDD